jgi:hypothetical protein
MQHHSQRIYRAAVMGHAKAICKKIDALKQQPCMVPRQPISFDIPVG